MMWTRLILVTVTIVINMMNICSANFPGMVPPAGGASMYHELSSGAKDSLEYNKKMASHPEAVVTKVLRDAESFKQFPDLSKEKQKKFSWEEVSVYDGDDNRPLYIVYGRGVYDITTYADMHPGGPGPLKKYGGRDATAVMDASQMGPWTYEVLERFRIGDIVDVGSSKNDEDCENKAV